MAGPAATRLHSKLGGKPATGGPGAPNLAYRRRLERLREQYLATPRVGLDLNRIELHHVLGVRTTTEGRSGLPLRPDWETARPPVEPAPRDQTPAAV